ncbi:MAG TPA: HAD-IIIC family phosphatase, partial [Chloroflexia bacterium]|nr:HAD-IIIC family phosphatase [Chloroflexia bacterium]
LEKLWRRGILLTICSKNNPDDALAAINEHPAMVLKLAHFAAHRINWESKAANIRAIAQELNIGLDSLVFLDDNPVERAQVRAELPQVLTPELPADPAYYRTALLELRVFDSLTLTDEDRKRNTHYLQQRARQAFAAQYESGTSLDQYLADLQMVVEIAPATAATLPRIAQLTTKTNQFNLTTQRYTEAQIGALATRGGRVYGTRVTDRFGDNGLVGAAILVPHSPTTWEIDTLLLSCRVMGRGVETALLAAVVEEAQRHGATHVQGWYRPTVKNDPVKDCYRRHGFTLAVQTGEGAALWTLALAEARIAPPGWLTVHLQDPVA